MLSVKLYLFAQRVLDRLEKEAREWYTAIDEYEKEQDNVRLPVYTPTPPPYDWEREEAMLRHPSNYKRDIERTI